MKKCEETLLTRICQYGSRLQKKPLVFAAIILTLLVLAIYSTSSRSVMVFAMKKTSQIVCTKAGGPNPTNKYDCCYEEYDSNTGSTLGVYCADCWINAGGSYACNDYVKVFSPRAGELLGSNVLKELKEGGASLLSDGSTNDTSNHIKSKLNVQELSPLAETNKAPLSTSDHPSDEKTGKSQKNDISSSSDVSSDTKTDEGSKTDDSSNKHRNDDLKERSSSSSSDVSKDNASP
jgi:hypothetical protein